MSPENLPAGSRGHARSIVLATALVIFLLPLAWTLAAAFGLSPDDGHRPPTWSLPPTLDHFLEVGLAAPTFWQQIATSLVVSAGAAFIAVATAFLAAYGLARSRLRHGRVIGQGFLILATLPVMAYVLPLDELLRRVHLGDTLPGVMLSEAAVTAPLATYVLLGFLRRLSPEWEEAAWLEGAGLGRVLRTVVLPLSAPTIGAVVIILFVLDWNLLLVPLVVAGVDVKTVSVGMTDFFTFERELDWPTAAAALTLSLLPLLIVVAVFHRLLDRFTLRSEASIQAPDR